MKNLIPLISALVLLGCTKDNTDTPSLPEGLYKTGNTAVIKAPVMYVQNRQITDTAIIYSFSRRHHLEQYFVESGTENVLNTMLTLEVLSGDSVSMQFNPSQPFYAGRRTLFSPSEIVIQKNDSFSVLVTNVFGINTRCDSFEKKINKFPWRVEYIYSPGFNATIINSWMKYPLIFENGEWQLPVLSRAVSCVTGSGLNTGFCTSAQNNWAINTDNLQTLPGLRDTIVVQVKTVPLIRQ